MKLSAVILLSLGLIAVGIINYPKNQTSSNGAADIMLARLRKVYPSLHSDQVSNAQGILNYAVSIGVVSHAQLAYVLSTTIGESNLRPIKEIRCKQGTACWKQQNKYWVSSPSFNTNLTQNSTQDSTEEDTFSSLGRATTRSLELLSISIWLVTQILLWTLNMLLKSSVWVWWRVCSPVLDSPTTSTVLRLISTMLEESSMEPTRLRNSLTEPQESSTLNRMNIVEENFFSKRILTGLEGCIYSDLNISIFTN